MAVSRHPRFRMLQSIVEDSSAGFNALHDYIFFFLNKIFFINCFAKCSTFLWRYLQNSPVTFFWPFKCTPSQSIERSHNFNFPHSLEHHKRWQVARRFEYTKKKKVFVATNTAVFPSNHGTALLLPFANRRKVMF